MSDTTTSDSATPPSRRFLAGPPSSLAVILLLCLLFLIQSTTLLEQYLVTTFSDSMATTSENTSSASPLAIQTNAALRMEDEVNNDDSRPMSLMSPTPQTHERDETTTDTTSSVSTPPVEHQHSIYQCTLPNGDRVKMITSVFPKLIIAGTQKGGTTSLRTILAAHPNLTQSFKMETHFFDRHCQKAINMTGEPTWCALRWDYYQRFPPPAGGRNMKNKVRMNAAHYWTFEKTPSYMLLEYVPAMIHKLFEPLPTKPKIVMMLRNPVDRAFSQYKMKSLFKMKTPSTFEAMIATEVELLREQGLTQAPPFQEDTNVQHWSQWPSSDFALSKDTAAWEEQPWKPSQKYLIPNGNPFAFIARGLYAYQIHLWTLYFPLNKELLVFNYDTYKTQKQLVLNQILSFINLPKYTFPQSLLEEDHSPINKTKEERMKNATKVYLQRFFAPYNALLEEILGTEWKNVWQ